MKDEMKDLFENKKDSAKSKGAKSEGKLEEEKCQNYYDIDSTITTTQATNPNDPDNINYNQEKIYEVLERNAPYLWVVNDEPAGGATLFIIVSHRGGQSFSKERPLYPQQFKVYKNVYELRLRGTAGKAYRVSEYELGML